MANFTYDEFDKALNESGYRDQFSQADMGLAQKNADFGMSILELKRKWNTTTDPNLRNQYNREAENLRRQYGGYMGGTSGGSFVLDAQSPAGFQAAEKPQFSYDMEKDPVYQSYQKQYGREGQKAVRDTLGNVAAATGGIPSSYAAAAAAQAGNSYAAQMSDKVPQLYNQAYNRYQGELSQYNTDRNFGYGQYTDQLNHNKDQQTTDWQRAIQAAQYGGDYSQLEKLGVNVGENPQAYQRKQQEIQLALSMGDYEALERLTGMKVNDQTYEKMMQKAQLAAGVGDFSFLQSMGINGNKNYANIGALIQLAMTKAQLGDSSYLDQIWGWLG